MAGPTAPKTSMEALHRLSEANIELMDIALRRPSLDEVFLALTGDGIRGGGQDRTDAFEAVDAYA